MGPGTVVCVRNFISGGLILAWAKLRGQALPQGPALWRTGLYGALTIATGNGMLAVAELWTPTGLASLFVATAPFLYAGVDAMLPGGKPLHRPTVFGLLVGLAGVLGLLAPDAIRYCRAASSIPAEAWSSASSCCNSAASAGRSARFCNATCASVRIRS